MNNNGASNLGKIVVILEPANQRRWQLAMVERLRAAGYDIGIEFAQNHSRKNEPLDHVLRLEACRFGPSLASLVAPTAALPQENTDLIIDCTGHFAGGDATVLELRFNNQPNFARGMTQIVANKSLPIITSHLNGEVVGLARPMLSDRLWLSRMGDEILAGALSLLDQGVARFFAGALHPLEPPATEPWKQGFWRHYLPGLARNIADRAQKKLASRRPFYWQIAYRNLAEYGPGIATEPGFIVLPDDGERFYADPFLLEHGGKTFLFVEEYPYRTAKGIISVAELGADRQFDVPRPVLEEPYHLSYPQVFKHGEDIFMLPESGGASRLVLYRAALFPDEWVIDTVLLSGIDINDATILQRDGSYWLFGTRRQGVGSASDTLVVYRAPALRGPWAPHKLNPIAIDRSAARPGGAFMHHNGRTFLPVQDGQRVYGGGLGLMELQRLDDDAVIFAPPMPVDAGPAWDHRGIHTLNRAGMLEVIDSAG